MSAVSPDCHAQNPTRCICIRQLPSPKETFGSGAVAASPQARKKPADFPKPDIRRSLSSVGDAAVRPKVRAAQKQALQGHCPESLLFPAARGSGRVPSQRASALPIRLVRRGGHGTRPIELQQTEMKRKKAFVRVSKRASTARIWSVYFERESI